MTKRSVEIASAVIVAAALLAGLAVVDARKLRVGVLLPFTGHGAAVGLGMRNSIRLAVDEVNARGGVQGRKVGLEELDDASLPAKAMAGAKRLVADKRVVAALVHYDPDASFATQTIFGNAGVPNILAGVSNRDGSSLLTSPTEFRLIPLGTAVLAQAASYAWDNLGARTFLYIRDDSDYGMSMVNEFRAGLTPLVGRLVTGGDVMIRRGDKDFSALIAQIRAAPPQYIMFGGRAQEAGLFLSQLRAAGVTSWFQSATRYPSPALIEIAKDKAEGAIAAFDGLPPEDFPEGRAFLKAYEAKGFDQPPSPYGIYAYAAAQVILTAMERSFLTRPSVVGALTHESFDTALGPVRFNYFSSSYQTIAIYQVIKGKWVPIFVTNSAHKLTPFVQR